MLFGGDVPELPDRQCRHRVMISWAAVPSFGDSEGMRLLRADFAYIVGKREQNRILIGYQHREAAFKSGDLRTDFTFSGPQVGFNFRF